MKNKKLVALFLLLIILVVTFVYFKQTNKEDIILSVNGYDISQELVDNIKLQYSSFGKEVAEEQIIERLIREKVILSAAKEEGISVSKEEVEKLTDETFSKLQEDEKSTQFLNSLLEKNNMSLEEYKAQSFNAYELSLYSQKLSEKITHEKQIQFENYIDELVKKADITRY